MGNRGKGAKGKSSKKGKGGKRGKSGGGATKWGDEKVANRPDDDENQRPVKKRRLTQEKQDRNRRIKIMELNRTKEREHSRRLSQPNREPLEAIAPSKPKLRRRKRPLNKRPARTDGRDLVYHSSSSSDDERLERKGRQEEDSEDEAVEGFDAGLASYKELLSALERSGSSVSAAGGEDIDEDLAAAVSARRLQREGRDDDYGSDTSGSSSSSGSDVEGEDAGEEIDAETTDGEDAHEEAKGENADDGEGDQNGLNTRAPNGTHEEDGAADLDLMTITSAEEGSSGSVNDDDEYDDEVFRKGKSLDGRSRDEFSRHFVTTSVFPADRATELFSSAGRPSFKLLHGSARKKWEALGLSASASRMAHVPDALSPGANLSRDLGVLPSLSQGWEAHNGRGASKLQSLLLPSITGYRDMLYCGWRDEDADEIRRTYALHALNHALTSQRRIVRHNVRLRKLAEEVKVAEALARENGVGADEEGTGEAGEGKRDRGKLGQKGRPLDSGVGGSGLSSNTNGGVSAGTPVISQSIDTQSDEWQRDQGFTRPKVLILLPFRGLAHELVETMIDLLGHKTVVINKDRFDDEYGPDDNDEEGEIEGAERDGTANGAARAERAKAVIDRKPEDWKALMGEGRNVDDMFTLGLSLSPGGGKGKPGEGKGVGVRLYCDFYNSDIIIASPVALHRASAPNGDGGDEASGVDSDFLSSVEVCIMDRADVFLMQNWAYVPDIAEVVNSRPTGERAARADFSRVRPFFLHEQGRLFRQTLVFSAFQDPNINALVSKQFRNHDGIVKVSRPSGSGSICEVALQAKQVFQRVPCDSPASQDDARFEYFVGTVLPQLLRAKQAHTAVFIPSYFDYVRVRNHLMKNKASVVNVHEYSRGSEVARSRARFFRGDRDLLLYTGRAHFFNRYCIRGIHHLVFYSLPGCPQFYPGMVNLLEEAESVAAVTCLSLFTRYERLSLERIVGEERTEHMLTTPKNTFLFC